MENNKLARTDSEEYASALDLLRQAGKLVPKGTTPEQIIKFQNEVITIIKREHSHMVAVANSKDNELRSYFRKNLPRNPNGAHPDEVELIYAEQRFIRAAKACGVYITSIQNDEVFEYKSAYENLEKIQSKFPDLIR